MATMRISQLAGRSGVPATTLRFYEARGLLAAGRTPTGYRQYGEDALERLAFIGSAKHLGLALEEIAELLAVWETGACADVKADLRPRVAARLTEAEHRLTSLKALTTSLHGVLDHLAAFPDRTERCDIECGFPSASQEPLTPHSLRKDDTAARDDAERGSPKPPEVGGRAVVCSLGGEGMAERAGEWRAVVEGARPVGIRGGVRVTLPVGKVGAVAELAAAEQRCCPFFDFRLDLDGEVVHLEVRGPAEAAGLINELFAP